MCWVISIIFGLVILFEILKWFFNEALPWIFRHIGMFIDWAKEVISAVCSWSVTAWKALAGWIAARSGTTSVGGQEADQSLLDSSAASAIDMQANISQPSKPMWPFGSKDTQPAATPALRPLPRPIGVPTIPQVSGASNPHHELTKTKDDLFRAQNQLKSLEDIVQKLTREREDLKVELYQIQNTSSNLEVHIRRLEHELDDYVVRYNAVSAELETLKPFASVKTDQRRETYSVSPELHKKWKSILRDTTRLQVLDLLGQPTEILAVSLAGAAPIQLIRKGVPAPRPELMQHVTNLMQGDTLLKDWVRGVGRTAWVYADDTLAPGVIFFASESDGGQVFRIFPPEC